MKKVVFWHTYLVNDYKLVVQDQIMKMIVSGLYNEVETIFTGIIYHNEDDKNWFLNLLASYPKFSPIIHSENEEEKSTVKLLFDYVKENDCYILYLHTKGVSNGGYTITLWRLSMDYNLIIDWKKCVAELDNGFDAVGCNFRNTTHLGDYPHFSGNFWWSKSSYIKTLDTKYLYDKEMLGAINRITVEFFIGSNPNGKLCSVYECGNIRAYEKECLINEYINVN